jgi:endogenous inhibitor of DNA gyrase (YacG/DUF329 family)
MAANGVKKGVANGNTDRRGRGHVPCPNCSTPIPIKTMKRPVALKCQNCDEAQWIMIYNKISKR